MGGKNGKRKAEAGRARPPSRSRCARETPTKGLRQVMMYRGKFPAENYTQTWPADLSLKGNRLPFSLAQLAGARPTWKRLVTSLISLKEIIMFYINTHVIRVSF